MAKKTKGIPKSEFWNTVKKVQEYTPFKRKKQTYKTSSGRKEYFQLTQAEEYKVLAERANKRLQRIEKYSQRDQYKGLEKAAYSRAVYDIEALRGKGRKRFSRNMPKDAEEAAAQLNAMKKFLRADTSTLEPGISTAGASISRYEEMARKFNEGWTEEINGKKVFHPGYVDQYGGEQLTWKEITTWYSSYNGKRMKKAFRSSEGIAIALGQFKKLMKENPKKTLKQFKEDLKSNPEQMLSGNAIADEAMKFMIEHNISPANLFKKRK